METEIKDNTASSIIVAKPKKQPKASAGMFIVWRIKGNHGWQKGYIKNTFAKGKVIHITENQYSSDRGGDMVAVDEIDWHRQ